VKLSSPESGVVTTEYKKFASVGDDPPFDFYMQIRAKLNAVDNGTLVRLTPVIKEQNRGNAAAFSERELVYFAGDADSVDEVESMAATGWRVQGRLLFMNVVTDAAAALGIDEGAIRHNETKTVVRVGDIEEP